MFGTDHGYFARRDIWTISPPAPIELSLVRRSKINGLGSHFGVRVVDALGATSVYDLQLKEGVRHVSAEDFAAGRRVDTVRTLQGEEAEAAWDRLMEVAKEQEQYEFDLFEGNCEHFARAVIDGEYRSQQVSLAACAGGIAIVAMLSRN